MAIYNLSVILIKRIKKNIIIWLALVIVFTIAMVLVQLALYEYEKTNYTIRLTNEMIGNNDNVYNVCLNTPEITEDIAMDMRGFLEELKNVPGVSASGRYIISSLIFDELKDNELLANRNNELFEGTLRADYPSLIDVVYADKELLPLLHMESLDNMETKDTIPTWVGYNYADILSIGNIYTDPLTSCKYEIVGVIKKDLRLPSETLLRSYLYKDMNNAIFALYDERIEADYYYTYNYGNSMYFETNGTDETLNEIISLAKKHNLHVKIRSIPAYIDEYKQENKEMLMLTFLFTSIAVVSGLMSILSSSIINIVLRKQELGIMLANGFLPGDIKRIIFIENGIKQFPAYFISIFITRAYIIRNTLTDLDDCLRVHQYYVVGKAFIILLILLIISSVIPIILLNRIKPAELMGGNEL